jgi:hypothetical protein
MRKMTDEEARWLSKFNAQYDQHRCNQKKYKQDTMNQTWISFNEDTTDIFSLVELRSTKSEPTPLLAHSKRGLGFWTHLKMIRKIQKYLV